jgi:aspartyl-tRNA(Asn)/glutamyl-tRNA(Gln) amidotransferase subunit A
MTELGQDALGTLMHYAMPPNPRAPGYAPGGSSTGVAVAVATGLARWGVGGDGLGSIRIPAAFCGVVGFRPGRTRLPRDGVRSPVRTLDAIGPITRTVEDCALLWQVMAGEPIEPLTTWLPDRIGVPAIGFGGFGAARSVQRAFHRALAALDVEVEGAVIPGFESATLLGGMTGAYEMSLGPMCPRITTASARTNSAIGGSFSPSDVARLEQQRAALCEATDRALARTPILAMPTSAIPPPALTHALAAARLNVMLLRSVGAYTPLANLCDLPAIAVPCGEDERGRPLSIMFVAGRGEETRLLRVALALERTGLARTPI